MDCWVIKTRLTQGVIAGRGASAYERFNYLARTMSGTAFTFGTAVAIGSAIRCENNGNIKYPSTKAVIDASCLLAKPSF